MEKEFHNVTLDNLGSGAAKEMFKEELAKVIANILDPNTAPNAIRKITLELKIHPSDDREIGDCVISVSSKLADNAAYATRFFIGMEKGSPVAYENNPQQLTLDDEEKAKIHQINSQEDE